jgi:hypothetical protein
MVASEITANVFPIPIKTSYQHLCDSSDVHRAGARIFLCPKNNFLGQNEQMVEYSECLKSWISIPSGKDRPLLAGVFWSAEEVDIACDDACGAPPVDG